MAEIESGGNGRTRKGSTSKSKKKPTRIDMTAMVDVAFLLLTFFVLTAVIADESKMDLVIPPEQRGELPTQIDEEKIITLILDDEDVVRWYHGSLSSQKLEDEALEIHSTSYDHARGLGKIIKDHLLRYPSTQHPNRLMCRDLKRKMKEKELSRAQRKECWDPIFVIKPRSVSKYRNLVDLLDEMAIYDAPKYAIAKYTKADSLYTHLYDSLKIISKINRI